MNPSRRAYVRGMFGPAGLCPACDVNNLKIREKQFKTQKRANVTIQIISGYNSPICIAGEAHRIDLNATQLGY